MSVVFGLARGAICDAMRRLCSVPVEPKARCVSEIAAKKPALLILILLASVNVVTLSMFVPSLPDMAQDFGVSTGTMSWSFSGYLLVIAGLQLIVGPLSDYLGRRPVLIGCLIIYIPASLGCALAPTIEIFFICRVFQGVIIGAVGLSHAMIRDTEPNAEQSAKRLATVVMIMAIMPMLAPVLGGITADLLGWRSNFLIMAIFGLMVLSLVLFSLTETNLSRMATFGQQVRAYPTLIGSVRFWGFALTIICNVGVFYLFVVGMPILGEATFDISRTSIGILLGYMPVGYMAGNSIVKLTAHRVGIPALLLTGRICAIVSVLMVLGLLALDVSNPFILFAPLIINGFANGLVMPTSTSGLVSINPRLAGTASGLSGAIMQLIGAGLTAFGSYTLNAVPSPLSMLLIMLGLSVVGLIPALMLHFSKPAPTDTA